MITSCENSLSPERISERAEIADVNARAALNRVTDLEDRVAEIGSKLNM